jgi:guanine deaminase
VYFAADRHDAAAVGFDDARFYEYFDGVDHALMPVTHSPVAKRSAPFEAWSAFGGRVKY